MSDLNRLRELAALFKPVVPVVEAKAGLQNQIEGLEAVVNDALSDLEDKLCEGGALETMIDKAGVSSLASNTLTDIDKLVKDFRTKLDKLLMEATGTLASTITN